MNSSSSHKSLEESPLFVKSVDGDDELGNSSSISVKVREFEGPLALLLSLVGQHKIDIYDIPIADITKQYLRHINETLVHTLENLTNFYKMAAWLLHIKSQMLLPVNTYIDEDEIDDPRTELVQTLIEYSRYKQLSYLLENNQETYAYDIMRSKESELLFEIPKEEVWKEVDAMKLLSIFMRIFNASKDARIEKIIDLHEAVTVREKIALIFETLEKHASCRFESITAGGGVMSLVCSFLAVLELMKQQKITVFQNVYYDEIVIHRK